MTTCVFRYCKNTSRNISESSAISFHRFIHPGHPKREEWIKIVQKDRSEDTWLPTKYSFICSAHFQAGDIYRTKAGKSFLKKSAVPCSNPLEYFDENQQSSPTSLDKMQISDSESTSDKPRKIKLKKCKRKVSTKVLLNEIIKLQRQNKLLMQKTKTLTAMVKLLYKKFGINKKIKNEVLK